MQHYPLLFGGYCLLIGLAQSAHAQPPVATGPDPSAVRPVAAVGRARTPPTIPWELIPLPWRDAVTRTVQQPTLQAHAGPDEVVGATYDWLLDHPDRASTAWRRLGIPASVINDLGDGRFSWSDGQGSEVVWRTIARGPDYRIWYADGRAKSGPAMPAIPVRAVAILKCPRRRATESTIVVSQEVDVYLHTDSKAASLLARLLGPTAPRLAEEGANQLLLFFAGMARYLDRHPDQIRALLAR